MTIEFRWLPVRCCCGPVKIFGFLRVPFNYDRVITVRDVAGREFPGIQIRQISRYSAELSPVLAVEMAVYSDDRPAEFWRNIQGFVECPTRIE